MWLANVAKHQGLSHEKSGIPCQDSVYMCFQNGCTVVSLADGAGSAKLSHFGAERVTNVISDYFVANFEKEYTEENGAFVKERIISTIDRVNISEVTKEMKVNFGRIGCQVDLYANNYYPGEKDQIEMLVPPRERMNYIHLVGIRRL